MDEEALKVYCKEHGPVETGVNESTGAGRLISVCVNVGPGQPGMSIVVQV